MLLATFNIQTKQVFQHFMPPFPHSPYPINDKSVFSRRFFHVRCIPCDCVSQAVLCDYFASVGEAVSIKVLKC